MVKAGSLRFEGDSAWLDRQVAGLANVQVDLVVVARRVEHPGSNRGARRHRVVLRKTDSRVVGAS
jgi:hypothetical protein